MRIISVYYYRLCSARNDFIYDIWKARLVTLHLFQTYTLVQYESGLSRKVWRYQREFIESAPDISKMKN